MCGRNFDIYFADHDNYQATLWHLHINRVIGIGVALGFAFAFCIDVVLCSLSQPLQASTGVSTSPHPLSPSQASREARRSRLMENGTAPSIECESAKPPQRGTPPKSTQTTNANGKPCNTVSSCSVARPSRCSLHRRIARRRRLSCNLESTCLSTVIRCSDWNWSIAAISCASAPFPLAPPPASSGH